MAGAAGQQGGGRARGPARGGATGWPVAAGLTGVVARLLGLRAGRMEMCVRAGDVDIRVWVPQGPAPAAGDIVTLTFEQVLLLAAPSIPGPALGGPVSTEAHPRLGHPRRPPPPAGDGTVVDAGESHDTATIYSADALAWGAVKDGHGPSCRSRRQGSTASSGSACEVVFAHDNNAVWQP